MDPKLRALIDDVHALMARIKVGDHHLYGTAAMHLRDAIGALERHPDAQPPVKVLILQPVEAN